MPLVKIILAAIAVVMFIFGVADEPQVFGAPVLYIGLASLSGAFLVQWLEGHRAP